MFTTTISGWDLHYRLACSPVLEKLAFVFNCTPDLVHLRSKSLRCVLLWFFAADEIAVVNTPLLEQLFLLEAPRGDDDSTVMIKIACAPNLRVLGFLEPKVHRLQIGNNVIEVPNFHDSITLLLYAIHGIAIDVYEVTPLLLLMYRSAIQPGIMPSPSTVLPSVKKLAFKVNFGVSKEVKMLVAFLRCFPNIDTLHIESLTEPTGRNHAKFWQELPTVECIKSHVKKMVVHEYRGNRSELEFLKFISSKAQELQTLYVLLNRESLTSLAKETEMRSKVAALSEVAWSCDCKMMVLDPEFQNDWSIQKAADLTVDDPFHW
uniref:Uncharacterized protein n=1 Tax=Aegilops tauschii TaxID=37682 RepID=R7WG21_AEGTA